MFKIIKMGNPQPLPKRTTLKYYGKCEICDCEFECDPSDTIHFTKATCPIKNCNGWVDLKWEEIEIC